MSLSAALALSNPTKKTAMFFRAIVPIDISKSHHTGMHVKLRREAEKTYGPKQAQSDLM